MARNPGRYLAPVALVAVILAVVLIARSHLGNHRAPAAAHRVQAPAVFRPARAKPTFYVIKAGDSLSSISVKTGVPIARLEALNPSIDPNALQTGQHLRLRP